MPPVQRMLCITVASFSFNKWSGNLEWHRSRRAGSGRGGIEHETVATFCQVIQLEYYTDSNVETISIKLCSLFHFSAV